MPLSTEGLHVSLAYLDGRIVGRAPPHAGWSLAGRHVQRYTHTIEEPTGRKVLAFLSQAHVEPDITVEVFFVDRPLERFGTLELIQP